MTAFLTRGITLFLNSSQTTCQDRQITSAENLLSSLSSMGQGKVHLVLKPAIDNLLRYYVIQNLLSQRS